MKGHGPHGARVRSALVGIAVMAAVFLGSSDALASGGRKKGGNTSSTTTTSTSTSSSSSSTYTFFPSASTRDGRFLSIAGAGLQSLAGDAIEFGIGMPLGADTVRVDIFDGETGGIWDLGTTPLVYELYADPSGEGLGLAKLGEWSGATMKDNDWSTIVVVSAPEAKADDGSFFYRLVVRMSDPAQKAWSNFKIRTNGTAMLLPRAFSFAVPLFTEREARIIYPNYPLLTESTYDGTWTFNMDVAAAVEEIEVWDGDMDYGSITGAQSDTDDPNTPNVGVPAWATATPAVAEGVAAGTDYILDPLTNIRSTVTKATGTPADDNGNAWYRRSPAVEYDLVDPNGTTYRNANPSGNLEWERFSISTVATEDASYDHLASVLPGGVYGIRMRGMDIGNLNAWRMWYRLLGSTTSATASGSASTDGFDGTTSGSTSGTSNGVAKGNYKTMPVVVGVDENGNPVDLIVPTEISIGGTGTIGYWKTHPESWPVAMITVGGITYSKDQALEMLGYGGDKSTILAKQLIAAKLNVMVGNSASCIAAEITAADAWLVTYPIGCANADWTTGGPLHDRLEEYNQGLLPCAQHRGSVN
jgi:hypothetical protein